MHVPYHAAAGLLVGTGVGWTVSPAAGLTAGAATVLIDVDHYLWYAVRFHDLSLRHAVRIFITKEADNYYCLCVFHTLEAMAGYAALLLGPHALPFWAAVGCLVHMAMDCLEGLVDRNLLLRKWSLVFALAYWFRTGRFQAHLER